MDMKPHRGANFTEQQDNEEEEQVFYEESGGVTKAEAMELIQGLVFSPAQSPMGVVASHPPRGFHPLHFSSAQSPLGDAGGAYNYGIISYPNYVLIFFNQDSDHPMRIEKRAFMPLKGIMADVNFYIAQGDFEAAAACVIEGIEQNVGTDENWELYCTAGEVFWKLRDMELASNMFLKAYQCKDCDQKAHVLCQAAATYCIMRKPDVGYGLYHKALQEEPESLEALHDLGGFHWDMGELDKAAQYYFSVLKKDPTYYDSYEELSNLFNQLGNRIWPEPFMNCFQQKHILPSDRLTAAEADMQVLLARL